MMKGAETAALALFAAIGAGVAAVGVMTQKTAEAGDQFAKTARVIGMTAETFQELDYAAKMSGVDNLKGSLEKLNKSVADVKGGTGALTTYLKNNDKQLLDQLKNVDSNEEAFNLLMDAIGKAPDEFSRAELAQAAFGKSGQELILLANEGADGIANLREEAQKYGVISNEAAANSEAYLDAQARLKAALTGVTTELTAGLMPGLTDTITKIADFIAGIDNWEQILGIAGYALAGVTAGLIAFLAVTKGAAVINILTTAFQGLTAAIAANPIGAIAVVVTAVLIPALIALYNNWDVVSTYLQQGIARIEYAFKWLASQIKEKLIVAFNSVKIGVLNLADIIMTKVLGGVAKLLDVMGKLPFVGEMFDNAAAKVRGFADGFHQAAEAAKNESRQTIEAAKAEQDATEAGLKSNLSRIDEEAKARRAAIEAQKKENDELVQDTKETQNELEEEKSGKSNNSETNEKIITALKDRLALEGQTKAQAEQEQFDVFTQFLTARADAEKLYGEERIVYFEEQKNLLLNNMRLEEDEKLALQKASNKLQEGEEQRLSDAKLAIKKQEVSAMGGLLNSMSSLLDQAGQDNIGAAILSKALASAQALINSYLAFTQTLADPTIPSMIAKTAMAGTVLATGLAQQVRIWSTPIPSAETGGRFIVPHSVGSDSGLMRVNSDEEVNITPRGMTGFNKTQHITVQLEKETIFDVVNDGIRSGDILIMASNYV
jgi:hypothetical protein